MKRVILLVIDALTAPAFLNEMKSGRYPNFQQLDKAGVLREQCVSIFPSITHAALTSIATGHYPAQHGIVASHWYDEEREKVVYFSGSLGMVLKKGLGEFFREFLLDLNHEHLQSPTIFQILEREGFETACVNFLIYHGDVAHEINVPLLLKWIPGLPSSTTIFGPQQLLLGDLLSNPSDLDVEAAMTGVSHWFGFRDENTVDLVLQMAEVDSFPDFTLAYFPENDERSHDDGPVEAHKRLGNIDEMLGRLFNYYGGLDSFLEKFMLVITGDHSQSATLPEDENEAIDLGELLGEYQLTDAGQSWQEGDQLLVCPNLRSAQIYFRRPEAEMISRVQEILLQDPRIDQLIYKEFDGARAAKFVVQSLEGSLRFEPDGNGISDQYGNCWSWEGDLSVVDGCVVDNQLSFKDYPNAFERVAGVLDSPQSGRLWLTAKIGHEFSFKGSKSNTDGGSHAALHRLDSQTLLFVAGAPQELEIHQNPRIIDIAPLCIACLEIGRRETGDNDI